MWQESQRPGSGDRAAEAAGAVEAAEAAKEEEEEKGGLRTVLRAGPIS